MIQGRFFPPINKDFLTVTNSECATEGLYTKF